jgi:multidrug efflux pump subunit AcrA (membrane-fusion protein)
MEGQAEIVLSAHEHALVVPHAALGGDANGVWVFRVEGGRARRTPVTLGLEDGDAVEVLTGLKEGDQVVVGAVQDGAAVP